VRCTVTELAVPLWDPAGGGGADPDSYEAEPGEVDGQDVASIEIMIDDVPTLVDDIDECTT